MCVSNFLLDPHIKSLAMDELTLALPPAPKLFSAVQIPGSQKATKPTTTIWKSVDR
jgi:hypothetical protein